MPRRERDGQRISIARKKGKLPATAWRFEKNILVRIVAEARRGRNYKPVLKARGAWRRRMKKMRAGEGRLEYKFVLAAKRLAESGRRVAIMPRRGRAQSTRL